jgi:hypothetical protein
VSAPPISARGAVDAYVLALGREYEISSFWGRYLGLDGVLLNIPNGFAHAAVVARFSQILRIGLRIAAIPWIVVGLPVLAVMWAVRESMLAGWPLKEALPSRVYLHASNDRNLARVATDTGRPTTALVLPWHQTPPLGAWATRVINLRACSSRTTLWQSARLSIAAGWSLLWSRRTDLALFTYSAPQWFWVYLTLMRSAIQDVWISNHVDRWASLADSLPNASTTIVQHGDLGHSDLRSQQRLVPALSQRLRRVQHVVLARETDRDDFLRAVVANVPRFSTVDSGLRSEAWPQADGHFRVLVVGHQSAQTAILGVMRAVTERITGRVAFAYRTHPTEVFPTGIAVSPSALFVVTPPDERVPTVDLVLSYASSVTPEIVQATNAPLVLWDPNDTESHARAVSAVLEHHAAWQAPAATPR